MKLLCLAILMCPLFAFGQSSDAIVDAWDVSDTTIQLKPEHPSLLTQFAVSLIEEYQQDISRRSVSRCPYAISCSHFCRRAIEMHGTVGLAIFIDRYFYRENMAAFMKYRIIQTQEGILKLDDDIFLFP